MGRLFRRLKLFVLVVSLFALSACAGNQLAVSGAVIDTIGRSFVTTTNLYNDLHNAGKVTDEEYRTYAKFAKQFKLIYPIAVDTWKALERNPEIVSDEIDSLTNTFNILKDKLIEFTTAGLAKLNEEIQ